MIEKILQKCLDELGKETPRLDYIRGMVEVLLAMEEKPKATPAQEKEWIENTKTSMGAVNRLQDDEATLLDAKAHASLDRVKNLVEKSTE